jgi:hypothetical protein
MAKERTELKGPARHGGQRFSHAALETRREALLRRLEKLPPSLRSSRGYKSARALIGSSYMRASLAARVAVLETAQFMISVLEMLPPL